jgi:recombination protein RecR
VRDKGPIEKAIKALAELPGFGEKSAARMVYWLLGEGRGFLPELVKALGELKDNVKTCSQCGDFSVSDPCAICADPGREESALMVVEDGKALKVIERTKSFKGKYHILGGLLSPRFGIGPEKLRIGELLNRIEAGAVEEVILALSSSQEGEATTAFLLQKLSGLGVKITRLARGVPVAASIEYLDQESLKLAIEGRKEV